MGAAGEFWGEENWSGRVQEWITLLVGSAVGGGIEAVTTWNEALRQGWTWYVELGCRLGMDDARWRSGMVCAGLVGMALLLSLWVGVRAKEVAARKQGVVLLYPVGNGRRMSCNGVVGGNPMADPKCGLSIRVAGRRWVLIARWVGGRRAAGTRTKRKRKKKELGGMALKGGWLVMPLGLKGLRGRGGTSACVRGGLVAMFTKKTAARGGASALVVAEVG